MVRELGRVQVVPGRSQERSSASVDALQYMLLLSSLHVVCLICPWRESCSVANRATMLISAGQTASFPAARRQTGVTRPSCESQSGRRNSDLATYPGTYTVGSKSKSKSNHVAAVQPSGAALPCCGATALGTVVPRRVYRALLASYGVSRAAAVDSVTTHVS